MMVIGPVEESSKVHSELISINQFNFPTGADVMTGSRASRLG